MILRKPSSLRNPWSPVMYQPSWKAWRQVVAAEMTVHHVGSLDQDEARRIRTKWLVRLGRDDPHRDARQRLAHEPSARPGWKKPGSLQSNVFTATTGEHSVSP